jgi:hypothetical protein
VEAPHDTIEAAVEVVAQGVERRRSGGWERADDNTPVLGQHVEARRSGGTQPTLHEVAVHRVPHCLGDDEADLWSRITLEIL